MEFQRMLGTVCSKRLPAGLHGCEGAAVSVTALTAIQSAVARAAWSKKLAHESHSTPAELAWTAQRAEYWKVDLSF